jgi:predicted lipoprotein with Yx(FWY)xxD motif
MRPDTRTEQLAYNGSPLYTFSGDTPGVASGNGMNGFSLARPATAGSPTNMPGYP